MPNKKQKPIDTQDVQFNKLVYDYAKNPSQNTRAALEQFIVADCYRNRKQSGEYSGGKSGSLAFDINPPVKPNANAEDMKIIEAQRAHFATLMEKIIQSQASHLMRLKKPDSRFPWLGSTRFQVKFDSTYSTGASPVREELNENVAELLVACISDELRHHHSALNTEAHPNAIAFSDEHDNTIIASQYMTNTLGTLSSFVNQCVNAMRDIDASLVAEKAPGVNLEHLRMRYNQFNTESDQEISLVPEEIIKEPISFFRTPIKFLRYSLNQMLYGDQKIAVNDLDALAHIYVLHKNQSHSEQLQEPYMLKQLVDEIAFSHLIADHDVNPGNFIVRQIGDNLSISRIDFGMANYHFTRGRIFGLSRRPFKNIAFDIEKESLRDFICRKKIGFGFGLFSTLVVSKTSRHLSGLKRIFQRPNDEYELTLVNKANTLSRKLHEAMASPDSKERIKQAFNEKIKTLPPSAQLDILRDLKVMELQSVRSAYLDFKTQPGVSLLKLFSMLSLTPALMILRAAYSPIVLASKLIPNKNFHLQNFIPLTTWTAIQSRQLHAVLSSAKNHENKLAQEISQCLDTTLDNINAENKHHEGDQLHTPVSSKHQSMPFF